VKIRREVITKFYLAHLFPWSIFTFRHCTRTHLYICHILAWV